MGGSAALKLLGPVAGSRLDLINVSLFVNIRSSVKSVSKVKVRKASNHCKGFLEAAKLTYDTKSKTKSLTYQKCNFCHFYQIAICSQER